MGHNLTGLLLKQTPTAEVGLENGEVRGCGKELEENLPLYAAVANIRYQ